MIESTTTLNPCSTNHHSGCKGHYHSTVRTKAGETIERFEVCACNCHSHDNPRRCLICGAADHDLAAGYCVDTDQCAAYLDHALDNSPVMAKLQASKNHGRQQRQETNETRPAPKSSRPNTGTCEHCGEPTKGGRFVAGHDAKLKGDLKRAAEAGDLDALVELIVRNWPTAKVKVTDEQTSKANLAASTAGKTWLAGRNAGRIA